MARYSVISKSPLFFPPCTNQSKAVDMQNYVVNTKADFGESDQQQSGLD